eukprot:7194793-Ditylum_brightwellii.AAC.2
MSTPGCGTAKFKVLESIKEYQFKCLLQDIEESPPGTSLKAAYHKVIHQLKWKFIRGYIKLLEKIGATPTPKMLALLKPPTMSGSVDEESHGNISFHNGNLDIEDEEQQNEDDDSAIVGQLASLSLKPKSKPSPMHMRIPSV